MQNDMRAATRAARAPERFGQGAPRRTAAPDRRRDQRALLRRLLAEPLDRAGERELRAAQAFDEVSAAADAERLQLAQLAVDGRVAARDPLGPHAVARDDPVPLEQ